MANKNLHKAKNTKNDEFYTQLTDIEKELKYYRNQFKGKVIMLPCDDIELLKGKGIDINRDGNIQPEETMSQFWVYFHKNLEYLGIKKIIATAYDEEKIMHKVEYSGGNDNDVLEFTRTDLKGNGDFRSEEVRKIMEDADVIVTNPPFSIFRDFVAQLEEMNKQYLIIGNKNAITYKEIFPLMKDNKMWLGHNAGNGTMHFIVVKENEGGNKEMQIKSVPSFWYTNLKVSKRDEDIRLGKKYNKEEYPTYDNYDAINVDKVKNIPENFYGAMGVPITFMNKYNPKQFEIIKFRKGNDNKDLAVNGKVPYFRIIIKRKECE